MSHDGKLTMPPADQRQNATGSPALAPVSGSGANVFITHVFSHCIIVEADGLRIWLDREEAVQLLDMLPAAINKMAVKA